MSFDDIALRGRAVPGWFRALVLAPSVGLAAYWIVRGAGPYRAIADWQMRVLGSYGITLTALLVVLITLLPAAIVVQVSARTLFAARPRTVVDVKQEARKADELIARYRWAITGLVTGVILCGLGVWEFARTAAYRERVDVVLGEGSWPPPSRWMRLTAHADLRSTITYEENHNGSALETDFIPLLPVDGAGKEGRVQVIARVVAARRSLVTSHGIEGTLDSPPSGIVRSAFAERGVELAADARVFNVGRSPADSRENGLIFSSTGGVIMLIGALLFRRAQRIG
jgi:hypothetical protein